MSYLENLAKENLEHNYLAVLSLKRMVTDDWTLVLGDVYSIPWGYGEITEVLTITLDGDGLPQGDAAAFELVSSVADLTIQTAFYDRDGETLYINGINPPTRVFLITYDLYLATKPVNWHANPTDTTSRQVHFEGLIEKAPTLENTQVDSLFGFVPISMSSMVCLGVDTFWSKHLYDSSFNLAKLRVYHWIDRLKASNVQFFITGYLKSFTITDTEITFETAEPQELLNREYRHVKSTYNELSKNFYPPGTLDKRNEWRPVRRFYGVVDSVPLVNFRSFKEVTTATDNHIWAFGSAADTYGGIVRAAHSSLVSTTTRSYLADSVGLNIGDAVVLTSIGVNFPQYRTITGKGLTYIEHDAIPTPMDSSGGVVRQAAGNITIVQNNVRYNPMPQRDFNVTTSPVVPGVWVVNFTANFEANLGMATLASNDTVVARIYGVTNIPTMNGNPFGGIHPETDSLANGVVIIYDLLKRAGIPESEIDLDTFTTLAGEVTSPVGFAFPQTSNQTMSTYREIIMRVATSLMLQIFVNNDGQWTMRRIAPLKSTPDQSYGDLDFYPDNFKYRVSYEDLVSKINLRYRFEESSPDVANGMSEVWSVVSSESVFLRFLHQVSKEQNYESVLLERSDAELLAKRLSFYFSERRGILQIDGGSLMRPSQIGDTVQIERLLIPGVNYDGQTHARLFSVIEASKSLSTVALTLEDQKGVEDNQGEWE